MILHKNIEVIYDSSTGRTIVKETTIKEMSEEEVILNSISEICQDKTFCLGRNYIFRKKWVERVLSFRGSPIYESLKNEFVKVCGAYSFAYLNDLSNTRCSGKCFYSATNGCRGCVFSWLYTDAGKTLKTLIERRKMK